MARIEEHSHTFGGGCERCGQLSWDRVLVTYSASPLFACRSKYVCGTCAAHVVIACYGPETNGVDRVWNQLHGTGKAAGVLA